MSHKQESMKSSIKPGDDKSLKKTPTPHQTDQKYIQGDLSHQPPEN